MVNINMGMMLGMGLFGVLVIIALVLAIVALIKYLKADSK